MVSACELESSFLKVVTDDIVSPLDFFYETSRAKLRRIQIDHDTSLHNLLSLQAGYIITSQKNESEVFSKSKDLNSTTTTSVTATSIPTTFHEKIWVAAHTLLTGVSTTSSLTTLSIDTAQNVEQSAGMPLQSYTSLNESWELFQTGVRKMAIDHQIALTKLQELQLLISKSLIDFIKVYLVAESGKNIDTKTLKLFN
jgi:hypothetical protein